MRVILLLLVNVGCQSGTFNRRPNQDVAEQLVWRELYGMSESPPPVEWVEDFEVSPGAKGVTLADWKVVVACQPGCLEPIRVTSYAHELLHWRSWLRTGDVDPEHFREDWTLVERAAEAMATAGMD